MNKLILFLAIIITTTANGQDWGVAGGLNSINNTHRRTSVNRSINLMANRGSTSSKSKSCEDVIKFVKSKSIGTTFTSYNSDVIYRVTFYSIMIDYTN